LPPLQKGVMVASDRTGLPQLLKQEYQRYVLWPPLQKKRRWPSGMTGLPQWLK
jgi:hypothetical protein